MAGTTTVALTGASGLVGGICREHWASEPPVAGGFSLRLLDVAPLPAPALREHEEFRRCDITQLEELTAAFEGCEAVVHLAAVGLIRSAAGSWGTLGRDDNMQLRGRHVRRTAPPPQSLH